MQSNWAICPGCDKAVYIGCSIPFGERQRVLCACGASFNVWPALPHQPRCATFRQWRERERQRNQFACLLQLLQKLFT